MPPSRLQRLFPISGVLFALVLGGGLALTSGEPDNGASHATISLFAIPAWTAVAGAVLYRARRRAVRARVGRAAAGLALLALVVLGTAAAASATAPGRDGSIVFRRYFDDQHTWSALFTAAADGSHVRQLTRPGRGVVDNSPDWSPDGRLIAFVRLDGTSSSGLEHLWTVHADGSGPSPIGPVCPSGADETTCPDDTDPSFAPDSTKVTFVQSSGAVKTLPGSGPEIEHSAIAIVNVDGTGRRVIYQGVPYSSDLAAPMLSPHGAAIVFERDNSGAARPAGAKAVFVIRSDGLGGAHRLTPWAENAGDNPDWSPDGNWILFHTHLEDGSGSQGQYFLIHPDGSGRHQISHFPKGTFIGSASFSPDGRAITFAKGPEGGNIDVYTMRLDGSHLTRVTRSRLWDSAPDWGSAAAPAERAAASAGSAFPSGTWRVTVTTHDLVSRGVTGSDVPGNRGVWNWRFSGSAFTERQQQRSGGPVTDVHHGRVDVRGSRVCFTDTGEKLALGCYTWSRSGSVLRFSKPTISGPLTAGDGPGILKAVFTAHPWRASSRALASVAPTTVSLAGCAFGSGVAEVPAGPVAVRLPGYADGTRGLITEVLEAQTTILTVARAGGTSTRNLSALWSAPVDSGAGFWLARQPDQAIGTLAPGETATLTYDITFRHPVAIVFPPVGPTGFNGPFVITEDGPYTCEVTA